MYIPEEIKHRFLNLGAVVARQITHPKRYFSSGIVEMIPFADITYFFDRNNIEIGYYCVPTDSTHIFEHGRTWDVSFLEQTIEHYL